MLLIMKKGKCLGTSHAIYQRHVASTEESLIRILVDVLFMRGILHIICIIAVA